MDKITHTLCGDSGNSDSASETFVYHEEDSVDIYAGLQSTPEKNGNTGNACRSSASPRQSESMDLFEEIIVEEHLKKEASYNEMKTKFEEARSQLQELIQKLQQLETQNVTLQTENTLLKKNICSLIKTARSEIGRKDAEINRLCERTGRGKCGQTYHWPQSNQYSSQASTRESREGADNAASACESHLGRGNCDVKVPEKHTQFTPSTPSTTLIPTGLSRTNDVTVGLHDRIDKPVNEHSSTSMPLESGKEHLPVSLHLQGHGRSDPKSTAMSSADGRGQNDTELHKDSQMATSTSESDQKHSGYSSKSSKTQHNHLSSDMLTSGKSKDHKGTKPQRHKSPPAHHSSSSSQMSKGSSKDYSEDPFSERSRVSKETEGSHRSRHTSHSERSRVSSRHRREKIPTKDYPITEERRKDGAIRESRSTRADKLREPERRTDKERSRNNRESTSKREKQRASDRVPERKPDVRESRARSSLARPEHCPDYTSHKKDQLKKSEGGRRPTTEKVVNPAEKKTENKARSEEHTDTHTLSPVPQRNEENDSHLANKESVGEGDGTQKTTDNGPMEMKVDSSEHISDDKREREEDHDACQAKEVLPSKDVVVIESASEESSPNRKLSFMETLNLTLSPVKKPNQLISSTENSELVKDGVLSPSSLERTDHNDTSEEFYVIDELDGSVEEEIDVSDQMPVALISPSEVQEDHKSHTKISIQNGETPVPDGTEVPVKSTSQTDLLKAHNEEENVEGIVPISSFVIQQAVISTETNIKPLTPQKETCDVNDSSDSTTANSAAIMEEDIASSVSPIENTVSRSCLDTEKGITDAAEPATLGLTGNSEENGEEKISDTRTAASPCSGVLQEGPAAILDSQIKSNKELTPTKSCAYIDSVSSTVNLETSPSCPSSCAVLTDVPEFSNIETESAEMEASDSLLKDQLVEIPKVSSTTKKDSVLQEKVIVSSNETQAELANDCEPDSTENTEHSAEPSSSIVLPQDEDSMFLTLKSIKLIPEIISPLTSPVRQVKKTQSSPSGKQTHIKSLNKDFQNATLTADTSSGVVDVNKENKKPDCSTPPREDSAPASLGNSEQDELEEGEIVSDCDSDEAPVTAKIPKTSKESKTSVSKKTQQSPQTRLMKAAAQKKSVDSQPKSSCKTTRTVANRSPSCRRRFKTVPPPDPKTLPPSSTSVEEIMNMFKVTRSQLRRKYMKLHKSFPMKTFSSVIEMSNLSFTDLVSSLNLKKLYGKESEIKTKLKKIIVNVMNKIANNGIVNRIFEQNSDNLKSKLWSFVDGQLDFLFKEIQKTLASKSLDCTQPSKKDKHIENPDKKPKVRNPQEKSPLGSGTAAKKQQEEVSIVNAKEAPLVSTPCPLQRPSFKTGLGSRGKNLKMNTEETSEDPDVAGSTQEIAHPTSERVPIDKSLDKVSTYVRRLSHSGSILDKSEFEILTEQQTSSLTFNLVSDSQMGDIFKSLLQGSDLLESNVSVGDSQSWLLGTPKKELSSDRSFITGMMSPTKFGTPSKLLTAWASISPCKLLSPTPKVQMPLNPAVLDESCLLEIPSSPAPNRASQPPATSSHRTYSILAEDLAVSLTIPSPLKTDSHLSFLHPVNEEPLSTPEEVINAHFSEDAVLDGEDATEHDIHLSLDTDNSSCESSAGRTWESTEPKIFQFKPHVPMQAVVTERSNDHFIVKIRHTSTVSAIVPTPLAGQAGFPNIAEGPENLAATADLQNLVRDPISHTGQEHWSSGEHGEEESGCGGPPTEIAISSDKGDSCGSPGSELNVKLPSTSVVPTEVPHTEAESREPASKEEGIGVAQESGSKGQMKRKSKKHHIEPKAKRAKAEVIPDKHHKRKHKKKTKNTEREKKSSVRKRSKAPASTLELSPQSLSAKNVIRKRGEVVVTWTRDEDRDILIELKTKGPSRNTFSALSEKMNKTPSQIAERFSQLMKLFKKKEKMTCSHSNETLDCSV